MAEHYQMETWADKQPEEQCHWLFRRVPVTWIALPQDADDGECILPPSVAKSLQVFKAKRYVWGTSLRDKGATVFWVTHNHAFLYECYPYDRAAHLAYARRLAWLIDANTQYIYLDRERYRLPGQGYEGWQLTKDLVFQSPPFDIDIKDEPEWKAPPYVVRDELTPADEEWIPLHPVDSYSDVISLARLFDVSTWQVYQPQGDDNRSVCSV